MSTTLANPAEMVRLGAPRIIHSEEELATYTSALLNLTAKGETTHDEDEAIDLLSLLIETYEEEHYPVAKASPIDILRFFMDQHGLSPQDLTAEFGSESTATFVLAGKQEMTRSHIAKLSARFHISPAVFFADIPRVTTASRFSSKSNP